MDKKPDPTAAGRFTFPGTSISVTRMGYGAMQLAGPHVFGEPKDPAECKAVLREAIELGIDHIDTSDFYGPYVTNRLIREALHPYPSSLTIVSKVGAWRDDKGGWILERSPDFLRKSVEENLAHLGLDRVAIVNLRMGGPDDDIAAPMRTMRQVQDEGLISHIGVSTVDAKQLKAARDIAPVVCVQNLYNLVQRTDDAMIDQLAADGIAYVPYFPLGGFTPLQVEGLNRVATELKETAQAVALAWLLHRSPNVLLIPGTSRRAHLHANIAAASIKLSDASMRDLNALATAR
jgi:pyridoxine 4-dehydrogenase